MQVFDEEKQQKKLASIREHEEEDLARILSQKYGMGYVDLSAKSINTDALRLVPETKARAAEMAIFDMKHKRVLVAIHSPNNEQLQTLLAELRERQYELELFMASAHSLSIAWKLYKEVSSTLETKAGMIDISEDVINDIITNTKTIDDVRAYIQNILDAKSLSLTSHILEALVGTALALRASDIHVEPEETRVIIRFRLDGVLTEITGMRSDSYRMVSSRIKLLSGLKLDVRKSPQDGRFSVHLGGVDVEIRTSILPGAYGDSVVMRILDPRAIAGELHELGFAPEVLELLIHEINKPDGMILNTGPTGSGKTTTLYAFLRKIHRPGIKIITIEDPIEYHLAGITQTQVDGKKYTFASGLRAALRQDPDVIMVGEIRDNEVASTALHAALTGHLVLSTLHTNNAAGAFPRLADIGMDRNILGSAVNLVMAQRLVRTIVKEQCEEIPLSGHDLAFVEKVLAGIQKKSLIPSNTTSVFRPKDGVLEVDAYRGRRALFEILQVTEGVDNVIKAGGGIREIAAEAASQGFLTLQQDGVVKALQGITTLDEVYRVTGDDVK